jgi:hypothetical protein
LDRNRANLLLHAHASLARVSKVPAGDGAAIRGQILAENNKLPWAPMINVVVHDGVVWDLARNH